MKCENQQKTSRVLINRGNKKVVAEIDNNLERTYTLNDTNSITITPLYIIEDYYTKEPGAVENDVVEPVTIVDKMQSIFAEQVYAKSKTKSTGTIYARRTIKSWIGLKIVSVHVQCNFYYNTNKAWYKSDFDGYYKRGKGLNPWSCSQWKSKKESSGTSYQAYARGVFCYGLQYKGNGLVIQEVTCKAKIKCSKNGKITKSYTPAL